MTPAEVAYGATLFTGGGGTADVYAIRLTMPCRLCRKELLPEQVFGENGDVLCWTCWRDSLEADPCFFMNQPLAEIATGEK